MREAVPFHGSGERLSAGAHRRIWAGRPIFRASLDPAGKGQGYTGAVRARVAVAALLVALRPSPAAAASLPSALAHALRVPHVSLAATGAVVLDLDTGATIYPRNATLSLLPASNEKLAVTYAALTALGPGFTIETDVLGEGQQAGTTWQGDLVLKGYGDPTLSTADLDRARSPGARERHHARDRLGARRRVVVRLASHGSGLEGGVLHQRVAAALGADRRPRPASAATPRAIPRSPPRSSSAARSSAQAFRSAAPRRTERQTTRRCRSARSTRRRSRSSSTGWTASATTSRPRCS